VDAAIGVAVGVSVVEAVGGSVGVAIVGLIVGVGDGVGVTVGGKVGVEPVGGFGVGVETTVGGLGVGVWGTEAGFSVGVGRGVGFALIEPAFNEGFVFIPTNSPVAGDANIPSNKIETTNTPDSRLIVTLPWG
jgi:hypothetical protein